MLRYLLIFVIVQQIFIRLVSTSPIDIACIGAKRERRFLGLIGLLAGLLEHKKPFPNEELSFSFAIIGASDPYRLSPFRREWSAELQVNFHKKHGNAVLIPGYFVYTPHGLAYPHLQHPHEPHDASLQSDADSSAEATSVVADKVS